MVFFNMLRRLLSVWIIISFLSTSIFPLQRVQADVFLGLPQPGTMVNLSPAYEPVLIKGLKVHPENPFLFDFIIDTGSDKSVLPSSSTVIPAKGRIDRHPQLLAGIQNQEQLKQQAAKLIKYFLASLTIPEKDLWVNLSPYEKDRIIAPNLGQTEMGRDMLAQDYILKQLTASLIYPEKHLGKTFWNEVYAKARQMYGTTQIPVNTFNKVWIVADRADVFERGNAAYIVGAHLKVMLEEDYLALEKHQSPTRGHVPRPQAGYVSPSTLPSEIGLHSKAPQGNNRPTNTLASQIIKQIILPQIEKEVNCGQNFAPLRQMFYSMVLASWYKMALKDAILTQFYGNKSKVKGLERLVVTRETKQSQQDLSPEQIYERYLKAYKKGVFNYIKDTGTANGVPVPRKYFSGGEDLRMLRDPAMLHRHAAWTDSAMKGNIVEVTGVSEPSMAGPAQPAKNDAAMTAPSDLLRIFKIKYGSSKLLIGNNNTHPFLIFSVSRDLNFMVKAMERGVEQEDDKIILLNNEYFLDHPDGIQRIFSMINAGFFKDLYHYGMTVHLDKEFYLTGAKDQRAREAIITISRLYYRIRNNLLGIGKANVQFQVEKAAKAAQTNKKTDTDKAMTSSGISYDRAVIVRQVKITIDKSGHKDYSPTPVFKQDPIEQKILSLGTNFSSVEEFREILQREFLNQTVLVRPAKDEEVSNLNGDIFLRIEQDRIVNNQRMQSKILDERKIAIEQLVRSIREKSNIIYMQIGLTHGYYFVMGLKKLFLIPVPVAPTQGSGVSREETQDFVHRVGLNGGGHLYVRGIGANEKIVLNAQGDTWKSIWLKSRNIILAKKQLKQWMKQNKSGQFKDALQVYGHKNIQELSDIWDKYFSGNQNFYSFILRIENSPAFLLPFLSSLSDYPWSANKDGQRIKALVCEVLARRMGLSLDDIEIKQRKVRKDSAMTVEEHPVEGGSLFTVGEGKNMRLVLDGDGTTLESVFNGKRDKQVLKAQIVQILVKWHNFARPGDRFNQALSEYEKKSNQLKRLNADWNSLFMDGKIISFGKFHAIGEVRNNYLFCNFLEAVKENPRVLFEFMVLVGSLKSHRISGIPYFKALIFHTVVDMLGLNVLIAEKKILRTVTEEHKLNGPEGMTKINVKIYQFPYRRNLLEQQLGFSFDKYIIPGPRSGFINFRGYPLDFFSFLPDRFHTFLLRVRAKNNQIADNIERSMRIKGIRGVWGHEPLWDEALELIMKMEHRSSIRAWHLNEMINIMSTTRKTYYTYPKYFFIKAFGFSIFDYSTDEKMGRPIRIGNNLVPRQSVVLFFVRAMQKNIKASEEVYQKFEKQVFVNAAMTAPDKSALAGPTRGGIDFNGSKMQMNVRKAGQGVRMRFDPALIERIKHQGLDGLDFQIQSIIPVSDLPLLLGLKASEVHG